MDTVQINMTKEKVNKNSIRYKANNVAGMEFLQTLYLMNKAVEALGNPEQICVTLTPRTD